MLSPYEADAAPVAETMLGPCTLCKVRNATAVCESCDRKICSECGDLYEPNPNDYTTWLILCDVCWRDMTGDATEF
jgi:hypothetical protein